MLKPMAIYRESLAADLSRLGVQPGDLVMVHASLRALGPVVGGAASVIRALLDAVAPNGTLAAYVDVELFYEDDEPDPPVFDPLTAPAARDHGILHEVLRTWPGAIRSGHPDAGVAAIGPAAGWLTDAHPLQYGYGEGSPLAKVVQRGGKVLMLGAPLDTITLLHHAEHLARIPDKRVHRYRRRMPGAEGPVWVDFEEFDTGDPVHPALAENCIEQIALAALAAGVGTRGRVAEADCYLFDARPLVAFGVEWLERFVREAAKR